MPDRDRARGIGEDARHTPGCRERAAEGGGARRGRELQDRRAGLAVGAIDRLRCGHSGQGSEADGGERVTQSHGGRLSVQGSGSSGAGAAALRRS